MLRRRDRTRGPNNCGKSAVVAALQILCHNDNLTHVVRHNERECTVISSALTPFLADADSHVARSHLWSGINDSS